MEAVLTFILGGGRGARLYPLTRYRSEPAVPVAGNYRLIDIPISNAINSGLHRLYVLTQYHSVSLHRHIANTYRRDIFSHGFIRVLAAQQTNESADWYQGTAHAIRQNLAYADEKDVEDILILSGDQLYHMDFRKLIAAHRARGSDITVAVVPVSGEKAAGLGIAAVDAQDRLTALVEKPQTDAELAPLRVSAAWFAKRGVTATGREFLANMGIYVIKRSVLFDALQVLHMATDLVTEVFAYCIRHHQVNAYLFGGYWEDLGTIRTYHQANLALASNRPPFDFHSPEGVIYTRMRFLPAARTSGAQVKECLISDGCVVESGARLERSVIGVRSRIGQNVALRNTVLMGANYFESERQSAASLPGPPMGIGADSILDGVIVDKNCRIGRGVRLTNRQGIQSADGDNYVIRDGIIVIPNGAVVEDGQEI